MYFGGPKYPTTTNPFIAQSVHLFLSQAVWKTTFRGPEIEPVQSVGAVGGVGAILGPLTSAFRGPEMCLDPHL